MNAGSSASGIGGVGGGWRQTEMSGSRRVTEAHQVPICIHQGQTATLVDTQQLCSSLDTCTSGGGHNIPVCQSHTVAGEGKGEGRRRHGVEAQVAEQAGCMRHTPPPPLLLLLFDGVCFSSGADSIPAAACASHQRLICVLPIPSCTHNDRPQ